MGTVSNVPICQITAFSVQPRQGAPIPMGHTPGISLKWRVEQAAWVTGPLQPSLYRHQPLRCPSSPNAAAKRPASKCARRGQFSWITRSYANFGRPNSSNSGSLPMVTYSRTTASRLYGLGGQPGRLMIGLPDTTESTPTAPVGFGSADGTPPQEAQQPIAITAAACAATSRTT